MTFNKAVIIVTCKQGGIALQLIQCSLSVPGEHGATSERRDGSKQHPAKEDEASVNRLTLGCDMLVARYAPESFPSLALLPLQTV